MIKVAGLRIISFFIIRRDRKRILIWLLMLVMISIYVAIAFPTLYPTDTDTKAIVDALTNPAMVSMMGPFYGEPGSYSLGAIFTTEMLILTALAVATMNILLITRHTRKDEEEGRLEVIRALPVGKSTVLISTLIVYAVVNILMGLLIGIGLSLVGVDSMDFNGSLLYGASLSMTGIYFAGITGIFAQLSQSSRGTLGYSFSFLGLMYLLRAIGDVKVEILSFMSPLGLISRTKTYVTNEWWPILILLLLAIIFVYIAFKLNQIRDLGASFIPTKPGRAKASILLKGTIGLAWRNQRITIIGWIIGMMMLGVSYGSVLGDVESFFEGNELYQNMLEAVGGTGTMVEQFVVMLVVVMVMIGTIPVVQVMMKLRSEERKNRLEPLLGRVVSRRRLVFSYVTLAIIVSLVMPLAGTYGLYSAGAKVSTTPLVWEMMMKATIVYLPAIWVFISITVLFLGMFPNAIKIVWIYLAFAFASIYFGGILKLPKWIVKLSPFGHVQKIPIEEYKITSSIILLLITVILLYFGNRKYNTRDLEG
ncbi:MAG: ABC transporter permease [Clostridiales bacterium]|nr:ABC transporter permease [Clostridiales bacterium]